MSTTEGQRPNILLLLPDQWRRDWTGLPDGVGIETPNIARLAERGTRFTNAFCPSPLCAPARACLASGLAYHRTGVRSNAQNYPTELPTFYRRLRDAGYSVLGCGKFDLHKPEFTWGPRGDHLIHEWGFSEGIDSEGKIDGITAFNRGTPGPYLTYLTRRGSAERYVEDMKRRLGPNSLATHLSPLDDEDYGDNWVARKALELLVGADESRPWFLQVNFPGPHSPFDVTARMNEWYRDARLPDAVACDHDSTAVQEIRRAYSAMCQNIDERIGDLMTWLRSSNQLDNTLVIFSSDHGEMLGDHDRWGKNTAFTPSLGVPLVAAGPRVPVGKTVTSAVSNLDITATVLSAAGLAVPDGIESSPLVDASGEIRAIDATARPVTAALEQARNSWRCALDEEYKLVVHTAGAVDLYAYRDDPHEVKNIAAARPEIVTRLERALPPAADSAAAFSETQ